MKPLLLQYAPFASVFRTHRIMQNFTRTSRQVCTEIRSALALRPCRLHVRAMHAIYYIDVVSDISLLAGCGSSSDAAMACRRKQ